MNWSREFSTREKVLLLILVVLLLGSMYYFLVARPVNEGIAQAKLEAENISEEIGVYNQRCDRMMAMQAELEALDADGGAAPVPDYDNLQQLMGFLNSVFTSTNQFTLSIQGIEGVASDAEQVVRRSMKMSFVSPDYASARASIERVQNAPYCCQVSALQINPVGGTTDLLGGQVNVTLTVTFYENIL